jgi:imidazolonepropionase-like amidohydrolase
MISAIVLLLLQGFGRGAPAAPAQESLTPVRDQVLIQQVLVWEGESDTVTRREDLLFRRGQPVLRGTIDPAAWPEALVVPAEENWILYPAFVHADYPATLLEAPANAFRSVATDPVTGPLPEMEYGARTMFAAHLRAADLLDWKNEEGKDWRAAGFSRVQVLPTRGLLQGRAAVAALSQLPWGDAVLVRDGLELRSLRSGGAGGGGGGGGGGPREFGYPSTPMAALAVHRQLITDATLRAAQGERARPAPDLELGQRPLWRARSAREVENLLDLMKDQPGGWAVIGGREAWRHAERLIAANVAVLYTLDLEDAPTSDEDLKVKPEAERTWWQDPLALREEQRREHKELVEGFMKLRQAGVRCALVPAGTPKAFADDLKQLLDAGADADDLQRALSADVAGILGLAPSDDSFISRGPLDLVKPQISWTFADGRGFRYDAPEKKDDDKEGEDGGKEDGEAKPDGSSPLAGDWEITVETPMGEQKFGIGLDPAASKVEVFDAAAPTDREEARSVQFTDVSVKFDFTVPEMDLDVSVDLKVDGDKLNGTLNTPFGPSEAAGTRLTPAPEAAAEGPTEGGAREGGRRGRGRQEEEKPAEVKEGEPRAGHPAWPVQTKADRQPVSEWGLSRGRSVLLQNATLYRMDGSAPAVGDLLIEEGIISAVGGAQIPPEGVPVVDARGWHLMPAVLDAHSHLALDSINEGTLAITAECRIADMLHPGEVGIWRAAAGGTAVALALHGSANPIGGQAAVWELDVYANSIAELLHPALPRNIKFALGENVKQSNNTGQPGRFPSSRVGVEATYRRAFTAAQDYRERRARAAAESDASFRRDERLEVLAAILDGEIRVQCHSYRADEIQMFLRICSEFGIQPPVFQHVLEGYKMAPELAEFGAMASTFSDWWAYKYEVNDAIPWNVEILHKAGVIVSINSDSDEMIRRLNTEAGKARRYGQLSYEEAMATCTRNSAIQMRLGDRLGSLEPGKDGTITAYDAPPLSGYARCVLTLARGRVLYERNPAHEASWQEYATAVAEFAAAAEAAAADPAAPAPEQAAPPQPIPMSEADWEPWIRAGRGRTVVVKGARIHDMVHPPFLGSVVARDGKILSVLPGTTPLPALPNAEIVDGSGLDLYPGFLNCGDVTGLFELGSIRSARDDSEIGDFQPDLVAGAAVHADSAHIPVTRTNGVAYVLVTPGGGTVRGQASLIQLSGTTSEDLVVQSRVGLLLTFPRPPRLDPKKGPEEPKELAELDRRFDDALAYGEQAARLTAAGRSAQERDLLLEALLPYARGEKPLIIEANDAPTLMAARAWAQKRKLPVIWLGARDAWKIAGFLGEDGARVITGPVHALPPGDLDPFDVPFRNPWVLRQAGCRVALRTADPEVTRNLPYQAATAAAFGLGADEAARVLTLGAAEVLGVEAIAGSIEPGKVATFFLCAGDPLDFGIVKRMWIGGGEVELESKQSALRERYLDRVEAR